MMDNDKWQAWHQFKTDVGIDVARGHYAEAVKMGLISAGEWIVEHTEPDKKKALV